MRLQSLSLAAILGFSLAAAAQLPPMPPPQPPPQPPQPPPQLPNPPSPPNVNVPAPVQPPQAPQAAPNSEAAPGTAAAGYHFSNTIFSATFNGPVEESSDDNGTTQIYSSSRGGIEQSISVHQDDSDSAVDQTTSDLHADRYVKNAGTQVGEKVHGWYQGHPYTAVLVRISDNGQDLSHRVAYMILDSRTAIRLRQIAPWSVDDKADWDSFFNSLRIR